MVNLPRGNTVLSRDDRLIASIVLDGTEYRANYCGLSNIVAYDECGHMSSVPWIAVYKGDDIFLRVQADHVTIRY